MEMAADMDLQEACRRRGGALCSLQGLRFNAPLLDLSMVHVIRFCKEITYCNHVKFFMSIYNETNRPHFEVLH